MAKSENVGTTNSRVKYDIIIGTRTITAECLLNLEKRVVSASLLPSNGEVGIPGEIAIESVPVLQQLVNQELKNYGISSYYLLIHYLCQAD
jgi:hypothetical protein